MNYSELDLCIIRDCLGLPYMRSSMRYFARLEEEQDMVLFKPSQNIRDAWIALEKFSGEFISLRQGSIHKFDCKIIHNTRITTGSGATPSLAICDAIIKAVAKSKEVN